MSDEREDTGTPSLPLLPHGWMWSTVEELGVVGEQTVLTGPFGASLPSDEFVSEAADSVPVLTIGCLQPEGIDRSKAVFVRPAKAAELERYRVQAGDLLFSRMASVGRADLVPPSYAGSLFNYHLMRLRLDETTIDPRFFVYFVRGSPVVTDYVRSVNHGMTRDGINTKQLLAMPVPVAPRSEQLRLREAVESHFTRLDDAVATLERVRANLKRYRASVLRAAVEGRLVPTEAELAQSESRDYEPASELLKRILVERRRRWEETELARLKATGKTPKDDRWRARYQEPVAPDVTTLPGLPGGWCWTTVDAISDVKGGLTKGQRRSPSEVVRDVPYLRVANVQRGYLDLTEMKLIPATESEIAELRLRHGDVLFNEGGDRDKLGRGWVWNGELPECVHQNHVFRARLFTADVLPKYLSWFGNTTGQAYFLSQGKQTTNLASINMTMLKALPVPLPPMAEQKRIAAEAERLLSVSDDAVMEVSHNLGRLARLRQAILRWAFEGKLVSQDPNDEPAAVLLERIKAERRASAGVTRRSRKPRDAHDNPASAPLVQKVLP